MITHNFVAKHLRSFNKANVILDKKKGRGLNRQKNKISLRSGLHFPVCWGQRGYCTLNSNSTGVDLE